MEFLEDLDFVDNTVTLERNLSRQVLLKILNESYLGWIVVEYLTIHRLLFLNEVGPLF